MYKGIYESDILNICIDEDTKKVRLSLFQENHFKDEIIIDIAQWVNDAESANLEDIIQ